MGFVVSSVAKDLRRRWADPLSLAVWLGIPFLLGIGLRTLYDKLKRYGLT